MTELDEVRGRSQSGQLATPAEREGSASTEAAVPADRQDAAGHEGAAAPETEGGVLDAGEVTLTFGDPAPETGSEGSSTEQQGERAPRSRRNALGGRGTEQVGELLPGPWAWPEEERKAWLKARAAEAQPNAEQQELIGRFDPTQQPLTDEERAQAAQPRSTLTDRKEVQDGGFGLGATASTGQEAPDMRSADKAQRRAADAEWSKRIAQVEGKPWVNNKAEVGLRTDGRNAQLTFDNEISPDVAPTSMQVGKDGLAASGMSFADDWSGGVHLQPGYQSGTITFDGWTLPPKGWKWSVNGFVPFATPALGLKLGLETAGKAELGASEFSLTRQSTDATPAGRGGNGQPEVTDRYAVSGQVAASGSLKAVAIVAMQAGVPVLANVQAGVRGAAEVSAKFKGELTGSLQLTRVNRYQDGGWTPTIVDKEWDLRFGITGSGGLGVKAEAFVGFEVFRYQNDFFAVKLAGKQLAQAEIAGQLLFEAGKLRSEPLLKDEEGRETWWKLESHPGKFRETKLDRATARSQAAHANVASLENLKEKALPAPSGSAGESEAAAPRIDEAKRAELVASIRGTSEPAEQRLRRAGNTSSFTTLEARLRTFEGRSFVANGELKALWEQEERIAASYAAEMQQYQRIRSRYKEVLKQDRAERSKRWFSGVRGGTAGMKAWRAEKEASEQKLSEMGTELTKTWTQVEQARNRLADEYERMDIDGLSRALLAAHREQGEAFEAGQKVLREEWEKERTELLRRRTKQRAEVLKLKAKVERLTAIFDPDAEAEAERKQKELQVQVAAFSEAEASARKDLEAAQYGLQLERERFEANKKYAPAHVRLLSKGGNSDVVAKRERAVANATTARQAAERRLQTFEAKDPALAVSKELAQTKVLYRLAVQREQQILTSGHETLLRLIGDLTPNDAALAAPTEGAAQRQPPDAAGAGVELSRSA